MDNYNPRQNTRMRWKDARELEKFIFLTGYFHFQTEVLENVLEDELYGKLYKELQFCADNITSKGVLITDTYSNALFIGTIFEDNTMQLINLYNNQADIIDINIVNDNELSITKETETFLSEDNVKTLFGNQSIIGQGNIDLYRHDLIIYHNRTSYDDYTYKVYITYYSSNSLKVDSVQDLTTLTKAIDGTKLLASVIVNNTSGDEDYDTISQSYIGVGYNGSIWGIINLDGNVVTSIPINKVEDTVTTI